MPQLLLPGTQSDTEAYAAAVADSGAGLWADPAGATAEDIADAARALVDDPAYREAARRLRADIDRMPSPAETVGEVERLLSSRETTCAL